ncbi:hypothetical protein AMAG_01286 [Allomyces macrogynus ATCC 38327]|uniref:Uncharacterized protein n=1 Tax=Allomyces macrogynus (strain ATCC 38327) TaxID=578462 RepID=A0A0L0RZ25_ALLM3|nr:hypothetical protein AMAG_01286 [Allomyces macrogynus ATCC 38327]|eukprot:KNE55390.1 hypothetical protein AMAG_01286 [Allomyces macrogynus ATCC 38327]
MSPPNTNDPHSPATHVAFQHALDAYNHGKGDVFQAIPLFEEAVSRYHLYMALVFPGDIFYSGNAKYTLKPDYALAFDTTPRQRSTVLCSVFSGSATATCSAMGFSRPTATCRKTERLLRAQQHYEQALHNTSQPIARLLCGLADLEYYKHQGDVRTQLHVIPLGIADCILARSHRDRAMEIYVDVAESMPHLKRPGFGLALAAQDPVERIAYVEEAADKADY